MHRCFFRCFQKENKTSENGEKINQKNAKVLQNAS